MVGTSYEMLYYLSHDSDIISMLRLSPPRVGLLRRRLVSHSLQKEVVEEMLTKVGCKCLRPSFDLPCMIKDKNGRIYDENTFVKIYFTPELAKEYGYEYRRMIAMIENGKSICQPLFKHLLKKRRAWIITDRMSLDSIWSYEPIEMDMTDEKVVKIRSMLGFKGDKSYLYSRCVYKKPLKKDSND